LAWNGLARHGLARRRLASRRLAWRRLAWHRLAWRLAFSPLIRPNIYSNKNGDDPDPALKRRSLAGLSAAPRDGSRRIVIELNDN
jgi:hypothetical protein